MQKLTLFVVATIALMHVHNAGGQKYYMNFAFNNNNPEGEPNVENGKQVRTNSKEGSAGAGSEPVGESADYESVESNSNIHSNSAPGSNDDDINSNSGNDNIASSLDDNVEADNSEALPMNPGDGTDDDNDDSDSMDGRAPILDSANDEGGKEGDHSHHSSYEISIDDSFGGRYVRSIYESSESHGHSGSGAGSGSRGNDIKEDSESGQAKENKILNRFGDQEYEEYIASAAYN